MRENLVVHWAAEGGVQFTHTLDFLPGGVFLGIRIGGMPSGFPNPDTISDQYL